MANLLATIKNPALVSRFEHLCAETSFKIDSAVHGAGVVLARGTLMCQQVNGKYHAYVTGVDDATVLAGGKGKILKDEVSCDGSDMLAVGYFEGFFIQANTTVDSLALGYLGGHVVDAGEIRIK